MRTDQLKELKRLQKAKNLAPYLGEDNDENPDNEFDYPQTQEAYVEAITSAAKCGHLQAQVIHIDITCRGDLGVQQYIQAGRNLVKRYKKMHFSAASKADIDEIKDEACSWSTQ